MELYDDTGSFLDVSTHTTGPYAFDEFEPLPAWFSPPHSDRGVDLTTPPDGLYEFLDIGASVQVAKAGRYLLSVDLYDAAFGFFITSASVTVDLGVGLQVVPVLMDGIDIRNAGLDGPYIAEMSLSDASGFLGFDVHATGFYSAFEFAPPGASFSPPHADRAVDVDADGRADFLDVDANLLVSIPGTYEVGGVLLDSQDRILAAAPACEGDFPAGLAMCTFRFDGHAIADRAADGPLIAVLQLYDAYDRQIGMDVHVTGPYRSGDFEPTDAVAPTAAASPVPYWNNRSPLAIPYAASDPSPTDGLASVTLWYRFSRDNATWGAWTEYANVAVTGSSATGSIPFAFPSGTGYYEYQFTARDAMGNAEPLGVAEARAMFRPLAFLALSPTPVSVPAGQQRTVQIRVLGPDGQPAILQSPLAVSLHTQSPTGEFRAVGTANPVTSVTIPAGQSSASVDYYDTTAGTWRLLASSPATAEGLGEAAVTLEAGPAAQIRLAPTSATLRYETTVDLQAVVVDAYGNVIADAAISWSVSGPGTLSQATGPTTVLTATSAGTVTVTATSAGLTASATFTVIGPAPGPQPSDAPLIGAGALIGGLVIGLAIGWLLRGRRGGSVVVLDRAGQEQM